MNPKIGICAPAHRPQYWMEFYKSLVKNDVEFEIVFVGPKAPDYELPKNFHFIKSFVKPTQCLEIAYRKSTADLVMNMADDCMFKTSRPLDKLYETYKAYKREDIILSCRYMVNGEDQSDEAARFIAGDMDSPIVPLCGLMSKNFLMTIGGVDRNFIGVMWDSDVAMRVHALGGEVILSDVYLEEDKNKNAGSFLCNEFWKYDRRVLESLWLKNGKIHFERAKEVESFSNINILMKSQGARGRWRGKGPVFVEKIEDNFLRVVRAIRTPSMYLSHFKKMVAKCKGKRGVM
ncbi:MAG: hypothetical protein ABIH85_00765 [Candidatus Omnitrophota bacterium]